MIKQPQRTRTEPIRTATIDKLIPKTPTPRVPKRKGIKDITPARIEMRERIQKHIKAKTTAWIPQQARSSDEMSEIKIKHN